MQSPHDILFGFTFRHASHVAAWIRMLVPGDVVLAIDWRSLQPGHERLPGLWLRQNFADLVFVAELHDRSRPLVLLVEHKSHADPGLHFQLLRYTVSLLRVYQQRYGVEPVVLAAVLRHGVAAPARTDAGAPSALAAWQPSLPFTVDDLTHGDEDELDRPMLTPLARLTRLCPMTLPVTAPEHVPHAFDRWQDLMRAVDRADAPPLAPPLGPDAIDTIGWYALAVTDVSPTVLSETFHRILNRPEETIMSTLERTYQKGVAAGKAEGEAKGKAEGEAKGKAEGEAKGKGEALLRILQKRFGPLAASVEALVRSAPIAELDRWTDRILDVATLADIFAD